MEEVKFRNRCGCAPTSSSQQHDTVASHLAGSSLVLVGRTEVGIGVYLGRDRR